MRISSLCPKSYPKKALIPTPNTAHTNFESNLDIELINLPQILNKKLQLSPSETMEITAPKQRLNVSRRSQALENISQEEAEVRSFDQSVHLPERRASPSRSPGPKQKFTLRMDNDLKFEPENGTRKTPVKNYSPMKYYSPVKKEAASLVAQPEQLNSIAVDNNNNNSRLTATLFSVHNQKPAVERKPSNPTSCEGAGEEDEDLLLVSLLRKQQRLIQEMRARGFDGFMLMPPKQTGSKIGYYNGINFLDITATSTELTQRSDSEEEDEEDSYEDRSSGEHAIKQNEDLIHNLIQETRFRSQRMVHRPRSRALKGVCFCKNSKCVKLYCECFKQAKYCLNCNCQDCENTPAHHNRFVQDAEYLKAAAESKNRQGQVKQSEKEEILGKRQQFGVRNVRTRRKCLKTF